MKHIHSIITVTLWYPALQNSAWSQARCMCVCPCLLCVQPCMSVSNKLASPSHLLLGLLVVVEEAADHAEHHGHDHQQEEHLEDAAEEWHWRKEGGHCRNTNRTSGVFRASNVQLHRRLCYLCAAPHWLIGPPVPDRHCPTALGCAAAPRRRARPSVLLGQLCVRAERQPIAGPLHVAVHLRRTAGLSGTGMALAEPPRLRCTICGLCSTCLVYPELTLCADR